MITFGQLYFGCSKLALNTSQMLSGSLGHIPVTFGRWWLVICRMANGGQWVVWTVITLALNKLQTIKVCNKPNRLKWLLKWLQNALWQIVKMSNRYIWLFEYVFISDNFLSASVLCGPRMTDLPRVILFVPVMTFLFI